MLQLSARATLSLSVCDLLSSFLLLMRFLSAYQPGPLKMHEIRVSPEAAPIKTVLKKNLHYLPRHIQKTSLFDRCQPWIDASCSEKHLLITHEIVTHLPKQCLFFRRLFEILLRLGDRSPAFLQQGWQNFQPLSGGRSRQRRAAGPVPLARPAVGACPASIQHRIPRPAHGSAATWAGLQR